MYPNHQRMNPGTPIDWIYVTVYKYTGCLGMPSVTDTFKKSLACLSRMEVLFADPKLVNTPSSE